MIREMGSTNLGDEISSTLAFLSKLASDGLLKPGTGGHPRLVFDENDINSAFKSRYGEQNYNASITSYLSI